MALAAPSRRVRYVRETLRSPIAAAREPTASSSSTPAGDAARRAAPADGDLRFKP